MASVDFAELKSKVTIVQVLDMLGISLRPKGEQLRGCCPICKSSNDRGFVVTPAKGLWFCFGKCRGGDLIKLVAMVRGISLRDAGLAIQAQFEGGTVNSAPVNRKPVNSSPQPITRELLKPLDYLQPEHEAVANLGVSPVTATVFESGYAPKGIMRGRYAVPIHDRLGVLLAYVGIATGDQSPKLLFPNGFDPASTVFNAHRVPQSGELFLLRSPLDAICAVENGIAVANVISILTDTISVQQLEMIAGFMDEMKIDGLELF